MSLADKVRLRSPEMIGRQTVRNAHLIIFVMRGLAAQVLAQAPSAPPAGRDQPRVAARRFDDSDNHSAMSNVAVAQ